MIKITKYTPMNKGALLAFCSIEVVKWCLAIHDISLFESGGRRWVNFPSKKIEPKQGEDRPSYFQYLRFTDKERAESFNSAVFAAVDEYVRLNPQQPKHTHDHPAQNPNHNETLPF